MFKRSAILWIIALIVVLGGAYYFLTPDSSEKNPPVAGNVSPSPVPEGNEGEPKRESEAKLDENPIPTPDLKKPLTATASLSDDDKKKAVSRIEELRKELALENDLYSSWMELALQMKLIGDYVQAEKIWQYAGDRWFGESTPYGNLGNLYIYELKDFKKAETYLLKAIERQPQLPHTYFSAYEFYRFVLKDNVKAKEILRKGMAVTGDRQFFASTLESF